MIELALILDGSRGLRGIDVHATDWILVELSARPAAMGAGLVNFPAGNKYFAGDDTNLCMHPGEQK